MLNDLKNINMKNSRNFILKKEFLNKNSSSFSNNSSFENSKILLNYYYQPQIYIIKNYYL